ncbi:hypothetical protein QVD17_17863 [Tagetes erecta]|uniref:Stigma-specific STIG1-like protein 1 n=1 Tax=Tagetes erecta TaxID=13708 RepID=A0AAD8NNF6_TARER|nr:hypothetical protein QVD17_17863 [Tagetes erecta]
MALAINVLHSATVPIEHEGDEEDLLPSYDDSVRGTSRFLAQLHDNSYRVKCNKNPRLCRAKGSPGPDCCKKKCVNVKTDKQNCGLCGKKCKNQEICCNGKCVNLMRDKRHCGGCNNRCKRSGSSCRYGMCTYA